MAAQIKTSEIFKLWNAKEAREGRRITLTEVSEVTGLAPETIRNLRNDKTRRFDEDVLLALCSFFDVPPGPVPFIVYQPAAPTTQDAPGATGPLTREEQSAAIFDIDEDAGEEDYRPPLSYKEQMEALNDIADDASESNIPF
jgi:transcriptional regulator with XRE-family HTH domain